MKKLISIFILFTIFICNYTVSFALEYDTIIKDDTTQIKTVIEKYFNEKYTSLGKLKTNSEIENLFINNTSTQLSEPLIIDTVIECRKLQTDNLSFDEFEISLDFKEITISGTLQKLK